MCKRGSRRRKCHGRGGIRESTRKQNFFMIGKNYLGILEFLRMYYISFGFLPDFATRFEMKMWEGTARAGLGACFKTYLFVLHKVAM